MNGASRPKAWSLHVASTLGAIVVTPRVYFLETITYFITTNGVVLINRRWFIHSRLSMNKMIIRRLFPSRCNFGTKWNFLKTTNPFIPYVKRQITMSSWRSKCRLCYIVCLALKWRFDYFRLLSQIIMNVIAYY